MWPVSDRFLATVAHTHDVLARIEFLDENEPVDGMTTTLVSGIVHVGEGTIRRSVDQLVLTDPDSQLVDIDDQGNISAGERIRPGYGEIRIWAGVRYSDATAADDAAGTAEEWLPVFTGPVTNYDLTQHPRVSLNASDRMWYVQRPFSVAYTVHAGDFITDVIFDSLNLKVPPQLLDTNFPVSTEQAKLLIYDEQSDPSEKIRDLATGLGWTVYADPLGVFVAVDEPELAPGAVVMTYEEGPDGALIQPKLTGSTEGIVNTWIVSGESPNTQGAQPWAKVVDNDPTSPTFVRGSYDERPRFIHLPTLTTKEQCLIAAQTYRKRQRGIADAVDADVAPNAAQEKGDVLRVTGGRIDRLVIADSFDYNLTGANMPIVGRTAYESGDIGE